MDPTQVTILAGVAFATSILSAIVGMAGGIILLSVMLLFLEPLIAIPLHGVVQLVSNSSRTWVQRSHLQWPIIGAYSLLLVPMSFVGLRIAESLAPPVARLLIAFFVLAATWAPSLLLLGTHPEKANPRRRFVVLGGVAGTINMTVGATGPMIAPFFLNLGLARQGVIGTKAACQALGHLVKIAVFGIAGFVYADYAATLALLCAMVIAGTWVGSQALESVNELWFKRLFKTALTLVALRLVLQDGGSLLGF